ncbi:hypothetical protein V8C43DRAFT_39976 [Trichoderma afarasin]
MNHLQAQAQENWQIYNPMLSILSFSKLSLRKACISKIGTWKKFAWIGPPPLRCAQSGARTEIRLDGYGRKRRHALLLLIGRKMGIEIWAQTQTHNTHTHTLTQNRKPPKKSHNRHKTALGREWLILSPRCEPGSFSSSVSEFH